MSGHESDDLAPTEGLQTRTGLAAEVPEGTLAPGTRIGHYRIEALLGRGGMGEVYRAEQLEPVRRTVALKRLHLRQVDARHLAHFEIERQMLAQMRHPAIAQVYDAGTTEEGHPFFAMEFIEGSPLTSYCEQRELALRDRLELFIRVCEGVQHAHQKGVVHRDLKPGNILVTEVDGRPLPKIIDFGIATAADRGAAEMARLERAGTPDYMSPEQAGLEEGVEIDTRSDVYSLGVLLYELIAGRRPSVGMATGEAMHTAATTPPPPSHQIDTLAPGNADARARQLHLRRPQLRRLLRNELDWVVLKAMRRDRNERYPSASALAEELRRFLDGRPVSAVPQTRRYVLGKYLARHRLGVAAAGAVLLAVLAGLALSLYGLHQANVQRQLAERRSAELERVAAFQQSMLEQVDIEAMGAGLSAGLRGQLEKTAPDKLPLLDQVLSSASPVDLARHQVDRQILANALAAIERDFADQPALAADLRLAVAKVQLALGLAEQALPVLESVVAWRESDQGPSAIGTLTARKHWTDALINLGRNQEALDLAERSLELLAAAPPGEDTDKLRLDAERSRALALFSLGERPRSRELLESLIAGESARRAADDPLLLNLQADLGLAMGRMGEVEQARAVFEEIYPRLRERLGPEHEDTLMAMGRLAVMRVMDGDTDSAVELQRERVEISIRKLGMEHPFTLLERGNLANMLLESRAMDEAEAMMREVLEARARLYGPEANGTLRAKLNLAALIARRGRAADSLPLEREVLEARRRLLGPRHPDTVFVEVNHATTLHRAGRPPAEVQAQLDHALPLSREVLGARHPQTGSAETIQALTHLRAGRLAQAEAMLATMRAESAARREEGEDPDVLLGWAHAEVLRRLGRAAEAREIYAREVQWLYDIPEAEMTPELQGARDLLAEEQATLNAGSGSRD
ncbi:MAG TPA: tetratricopeptide repeat protein [Arenimonas sp.]|jgi:serine/threonine protein kinase|nr:tetratricopeptide repeat protein [Arenimonas sp.]